MTYAAESEIVFELAKGLISFMRDTSAYWSKAFYRFECEPGHTKANGSFVEPNGVTLISAIRNKSFFDTMGPLAAELFTLLRERRGVLLLEACSDFTYNIQYEWADLDRWQITKLDGATGIPAGLE